jgi:hypothetical protein
MVMPIMFREKVKTMTDDELATELASISKMRGPNKTKRKESDSLLKGLSNSLKNMSLEELEAFKKEMAGGEE